MAVKCTLYSGILMLLFTMQPVMCVITINKVTWEDKAIYLEYRAQREDFRARMKKAISLPAISEESRVILQKENGTLVMRSDTYTREQLQAMIHAYCKNPFYIIGKPF